jgi:hypothetical protein
VSAPVGRGRFQVEINGGEMGASRQAGLSQKTGRQQSAKPGRVLQDLQGLPGIQENNRPQYRRQAIVSVRTPRHSCMPCVRKTHGSGSRHS